MKKLLSMLMAVSLVILAIQCSNPVDTPTTSTVTTITTTVAGIVTDANGVALAGVNVVCYGKTAVTNSYGSFLIDSVKAPSDRAVISFKKSGYFNGFRAEAPKQNGLTEVRVAMSPATIAGNFAASSGGTFAVGNGKVEFPANAIVTSSGAAYTGTVTVVARHLDPASPRFYNQFSGDMLARRSDGSNTELYSYGVHRVMLKGSNGEDLNLASGKTATLTYPIASFQQKSAPATMPLWYFDESTAMWKEDGTVTKVGTSYVGTVTHFTDWNCDYPERTATIKGRILCGEEGVPGIVVRIGERHVITDENGNFARRVPVGIEFSVDVPTDANDGIYSSPITVGPLTVGEVKEISLPLTVCPSFIVGKVKCGDAPLAASIITSWTGGATVTFTSKGDFKVRVRSGIATEVQAISTSGALSDKIAVPALAGSEVRNIGTISLCNDNNNVVLWDVPVGDLSSKEQQVFGVAFSADDSKIATGLSKYSNSGQKSESIILIHDYKTGALLNELKIDAKTPFSYSSLEWSDDGSTFLLTSYYSGVTTMVVDAKNGTVLKEYPNYFGAHFVPNSTDFVCVNSTNNVLRFTTSGTQVGSYPVFIQQDSSATEMLVGAYGNNIVTIQENYAGGTPTTLIRVWDMQSNTLVREVTDATSTYVQNATLSRNGATIAYSSYDRNQSSKYYFWSTASLASPLIYTAGTAGTTTGGSLALMPDASGFVAHAGVFGLYTLPGLSISKPLALPNGNTYLQRIQTSPLGNYASGAYNTTQGALMIRVWKLK